MASAAAAGPRKAAPLRGEIWSADLEPQSRRSEPGKTDRPVLIIQIDLLNDKERWHNVIVIPGTTDVDAVEPAANYPLRVRVQKAGSLKSDTDLLISEVRSIAKDRLRNKMLTLAPNHLKKITKALAMLTGYIPVAAD